MLYPEVGQHLVLAVDLFLRNMEVARRRRRRRKKLLDDLKDRRGYSHLKE